MKKVAVIVLVLITSCYGCSKDDTETSKFEAGTFSGQKTVHYFGTNYYFADTITIVFEGTKYTYFGSASSHPPDFGSGNFLIKNNSLEFEDEVARIALYTWDWILAGKHQYRTFGDSLILSQKSSSLQISCRLKKMTISK